MGGAPSLRAGLVVALLTSAVGAHAQYKVLGPNGCLACHDHSRQAQKWQKDEPRELQGRAHFATRKQLDAPKAAAFARAISLADPYDLKGSCVTCHATVFKGDANAGVSCESCHGPASGYNEAHQPKGAYAKALTLGMADLRGKPSAIAKTCVECHVTPDKRLAAAGHPVGDRFDAGVSLRKIVHWNTAYDFAAVTAAGRVAATARLGKGAPPPPPPTASGSGAGGKTAAPTAASARTAAASTPSSAPAATGSADPWDWDQPVKALPKDYVPDGKPETAEPTAAPTKRPRREEPPRSIAYDSPLPPPVPGATDNGPLTPAVAPAEKVEVAAPTPAPPATDARSRALGLLEKALRSGARAPQLPAAQKPQEFDGPDGELLRIQDEVMALAIEALRRKP